MVGFIFVSVYITVILTFNAMHCTVIILVTKQLFYFIFFLLNSLA
jgi:hypothetical protein